MVLVLDIGSKYIHFVEGEYKNKKLSIKKIVKELTPKGCVEDGDIIDMTRLKLTIKEALRTHDIKSKKVQIALSTTKVVARELMIPKVKPKEIYAVLEGELSSVISQEEEYLIEYKQLAVEKEHLKMQVMALPKELVEKYKILVEELKLKPIGLDIHQNAMEHFVNLCDSFKRKNIVVADIGNTCMNTYLFNNQERKFSNKIGINTEQCERTLLSVRRIEVENKDFYNIHIAPQDLEEDIILDTTMTPYLTSITQQISSIIQFQHTLNRMEAIKEIYLCGGASRLMGITEYLEEVLGIPVYLMEETFEKPKDMEDSILQYCNAIGAFLADVNFFKRYKIVEHQNKTLQPKTVARISILSVLIIGIAVATLGINMLKFNAQMQIESINSFLQSEVVTSQLEQLEAKDKAYQAITQYNEAVTLAYKKIQTLPEVTQKMLDDLAKRIPSEVTTTHLEYSTGQLRLSCVATSKEAINSFVHALRKSEYVHAVGYTGYTGGENGYSFNVEMTLVPGGDN